MATNGRIPAVCYVYDIPYATRRRLCMVLDGGGAWKTLAGELGYSSEYIRYCELALQRPGGSPTDDILNEWGHRNSTVTSLFRYLRDMKHYRALSILKHLVPEEMYRGIELCEVAGEEKVVRQPLVINNVNRCEEQRHTSDLPAPPPHFPIQDQQNIPQSSKAGENGDEASNAISYTENAAYSDCQEVSARCETAIPGGYKSMKDAAQKRMPVESLDTSLPTKGKGDLTTLNMRPDKSAMPYNRNAQLELKALSQSAALMNTQRFSHSEITQATYGFHDSNLLGNGGFGRVYKGILKKTLFAIKQLKNKSENNTKVQQQQHMAEIEALLRYRHDNIIQLCGYSMEGPQLCLVYQYMENGSLENRLVCKDGTKPLCWRLRHHILTGSARGIQYLHSLDEKPLIHGDIKSANILLDRHFDPKVADFGLAKQATSLGQSGQFTHVSRKDSEKVFGSVAYLPDEFFGTYQFSTKTDTYSFGVVIYETCTGEQAQDEKREGGVKLKNYIDKIWSLDNHDEFQQRLQDKKAPDWPAEPWAALMRLGQECTSPKKKQRPTMQNVLSLLEKIEGDSCTTPGSVASLSEGFMHLSYRSEGQGQNNLAANLENGHDPDDDRKLVLDSSNVSRNAADSESCTSNGKLSQIGTIPDSHANQIDNDPDDLPYDRHKLELDSTESTCNVTDRGRELDQKLDQTPGKPEGSPGEQGDDRSHMASSNDDLSTCDTDTSCTDVDKQSSLFSETCWLADTNVAVDGLSDTRSCSAIESGKESIQIKGLMEDISKLGNDMSSPAKQEWAFDDAEVSRKCSKKRPQFVLDFLSTGDESGDQCNGAASMMSDSCFTKGEQQDTAIESTDLYGPAPLGDKIGAKSQ